MDAANIQNRWCRAFVATACLAVVGLAGAALVGWSFDIAFLRSMGQPVLMNPMSAVCLLSAAAALWLLRREKGAPLKVGTGRLLALGVAATGILKLFEYWTGLPYATDQLLFAATLNGSRMAPNTALCLTFVGLGLFLLDAQTGRGYRVAPVLFLGAALITFLALVGYVYTVLWLYAMENRYPMALNTAAAFGALCVGALCARPRVQPMQLLLRDWTLEKKVSFGFITALATLVFIAFTGYRSAAIVIEMQARGSVARNTWDEAAIRSAHQMMWTAGLGGGLAFVLVAVACWLSRRDIRKRFQVAQALRESEALNRRILESSSDGVKVLSRTGRLLSINRAGYEHMEIEDPASCIDADWLNFWDGEHRQMAQAALDVAISGGTGVFEGFRTTTKGKPRWWDVRITPLIIDGQVEKLLCISRDITGQRQAQQKMLEQKTLLIQILSLAPYSIFWKDRNSVFMGCNQLFAIAAGLADPRQIVGKTDYDLPWPRERADAYHACDQRVMSTGHALLHVEEEITNTDGSRQTLLMSKVPIRDPNGQIVGVLGTFTDISDRKKMESDLRHAKETAEAASRTKSEFLAHMSHEIRTPLNGVIGMTDLLLGLELTGTQRHYAQLVKSSGESLAALLNDILDFSKIEAGKLEIESVEFDLLSTVEDIAEVMVHKATQKGLEIDCHAHVDVSRLVRGDPERVRQILVNLVNNAIKFTDAGSISIRMTLEGQTAEGIVVRFSVTDTGIGIPPERKYRLFKSFSQVDASTTRKYGGTGLGLAISKQLAELMGGQIGVESEVGGGSTFWFTVCFASAEPVTPAAIIQPYTPDIQGMRVLAIDDNPGSREALREQIASWGLEAVTATGGADALRALTEAASLGRAYRVAIVDEDMPDMSGLELARAIRADDALQDAVLMILLSAQAQIDPAQLKAAGFAGYMTKPVRQSQLFDTIISAIAATEQPSEANTCRAAQRPSSTAPMVSTLKGVRVLLAEDNGVNQIVASEILRKHGYAFDIVEDGRKAIEAACNIPYDLVLMDCQMPQVDGFDATQEIRRWEASRHPVPARRLPIIALTANAIKGDKELCLAAGMDAYVSKPINPSRLIEVMESLLCKPIDSQPARPTEGVNGRGHPTPLWLEPRQFADPPFHIEPLLEVCMGNLGTAASVLDEFERQLVADVEKVEGCIVNNDCKYMTAVGHALKGAAGMVHAESVREIASRLEQIGRAEDLSTARESLQSLKDEVRRCLDYLPTAKTIVSAKIKH